MRALTVIPEKANSLELSDIPEPEAHEGDVLVDVVAVGICGTDAEIMGGGYGEAPPGHDRLVLGHESLGRVREAPSGSELAEGDLVACIVRCPDPVPCPNCAAGQWDFCSNGQYTEHGIKGLDGFMRERYRSAPDRLVKADSALGLAAVLLAPTTTPTGWRTSASTPTSRSSARALPPSCSVPSRWCGRTASRA